MPKQATFPNQETIDLFIMPIVNGSYVPDILTDAKSAQKQVFGEYSGRDMADYSAAAYNYLMKQQEQAYNLELWKLQNEYNTPAAQMARYQDAGLNPNLIYGQSNEASAPASASAPSFRTGNVQARKTQNAINTIGQFRQIIESAFETYQYFSPYGRNMRSFEQQNAGIQQRRYQAEADWLDYLTYGRRAFEDPASLNKVSTSPRAVMYNLQANTQEQNYYRLKALADMIPDQQARQQALKALDDKRLQIMQGQNDALLNIHTGNDTVDSWLKALMYFAMSKL